MKICVKCLTLQGDEVMDCPQCGIGLVPYALWRKNQGAAGALTQTFAAPGMTPTGPSITSAMTGFPGRGSMPPAGIAAKPKHDGMNIVLGIFLSSLAFFVAFLAAYVFVELKK